jgi:hypothetical protein
MVIVHLLGQLLARDAQFARVHHDDKIAQLDPRIVVPMPVCEVENDCAEAMARFLHEMGTTPSAPQAKLTITISGLPDETTTVLLESRAKA